MLRLSVSIIIRKNICPFHIVLLVGIFTPKYPSFNMLIVLLGSVSKISIFAK